MSRMVINPGKFDAAVCAAVLAVLLALFGLVFLYDIEIVFPQG